jgi:hypothetical protein
MLRWLGLAFLLAVLAAPAAAQNFTGTFTLRAPNGGTVTVELAQDAQGRVSGSMSGNGVSYRIDGALRGPQLVGTASAPGSPPVYVEGGLNGAELHLLLADFDANRQPNYAGAREVVFTRGGGTPAAPSGNPLAQAGPGDPYLGQFAGSGIAMSIASAAGGYSGTLQVNGQSYPITASRTGDHLAGSFASTGSTFAFEARLQGEGLSLTSAGQTYVLSRAGSAAAAADPAPPPSGGSVGGGPQDQQLAQLLLSSPWCSLTYSQTSGRSSTIRSVFTPDGLLSVSTNSEGGTVNQHGGGMVALGGGGTGSVYSQQAGATQARWTIQGGLLYLDFGQGPQPQMLQITRNSNGYPIITADGREYSQCR